MPDPAVAHCLKNPSEPACARPLNPSSKVLSINMSDSVRLKTVVVPAAGLGTRFLPATKTVPKELLPVVGTPGIELIAREAAEAGAQRLAVITAPKKAGVMGHFDQDQQLEETLEARGKLDLLEKVQAVNGLIHPQAVVQDKPLGLGHAISLAEEALDEDEDCFAVMLPDDLVLPFGVMDKMLAIREEFGGSVLCAFEVPQEDVSNYGVFDIDEVDGGREDVKCVRGMVEKPAVEDAPSNFVATGRYLLDRQVFDALRRTKPGKGGEIQITDAIELMITEGHPVHILVHHGKRHDLGNPGGYIRACVDFALDDPTYGPSLDKWLRNLLDSRK
ncbi:UTP--glucose-1-phosphate uridylyltransferase [Corynebacterium sp. zg254]|nr:UTP--glucose-1-phosphate uridylyltransferase [Corynebacterium sp. zg254]